MKSFFSLTRALVARKRKIFALFFALAASIGLSWAETTIVTWNNDDLTGEWGTYFSKDGVTINVGEFLDFENKNFLGGGTFTTTLGNFTKIEVYTEDADISGEGWSGNSEHQTWTGNASSVSFSGDIHSNGNGITFMFTIGDPAPTYTIALQDGTANADKVTLSATSVVEGATVTVTPNEEYEITDFTATYNTTEELSTSFNAGTGAYSFTMPAANVTIEATIALKPVPEGDIFAGFTATAGSGGFDNEGHANLVDGKFTSGNVQTDWTKWCTNNDHRSVPTGESGDACWWIDFEASAALDLTGYILTTGNDTGNEHGRNPKNWVLKAKLNADDAWTTIATVTDDVTMKDKSFKDYKFFVDQSGSYKYFRFEVFANQGAGVMQLCELRLIGTEAPAPVTTTVTWDGNTLSSIAIRNGEAFTEGDVTVTVLNGQIDRTSKWKGNSVDASFKFSTSLGNFTKIEITGEIRGLGGSGWTQTSPGAVWTGDANEITFGMYFRNVTQVEFTIEEPAPTPAEETTTVTWNSTDFTEEGNFTSHKGIEVNPGVEVLDIGTEVPIVTISPYGPGSFSTTNSNLVFTKIEVSGGEYDEPSFEGEGWSDSEGKRVWEGQAATVPFNLGFISTGDDEVNVPWTIVFTLAPASSSDEGAAGALKGAFSVADGKVVYFSKGNLQYNSGTQAWQFAENQYDFVGAAAGNTSITADGIADNNGTVDLFGWVGASSTWTGLKQYGITTSTATYATDGYGDNDSEALKSDWGTTMGTGWFTLSTEQWQYLFNTRSGATVNGTANARYTEATINTDGTGVNGIILFPDDFDLSKTDGATTWGTINGGSDYETKLTTAQWNSFEEAGCVFLPAAGYRKGTSVSYAGSDGYYWSSSPYPTDQEYAYYVRFMSYSVDPDYNNRYFGYSVRLVTETAPAPDPAPAYETVMNLINEIGTVELTAECKAKIDAARAAYDALSDGDKDLVTNIATLTTAEEAFENVMNIWLSGDCDVILWKDTTLTVKKHAGEGNGAMADYTSYYGDNTAPWFHSRWYNPQPGDIIIKSVKIENGVTRIGDYAFGWMNEMKTVTIPASVTSIGEDAFYWSKAVDDIYLFADPSNLIWVLPHSADNQFKAEKATRCHVPADLLTAYQEKFGTLNMTFVGDLDPITPLTPEQQQALDAAKDKIAVIPSPVVYTPACKDAIDDARAAYDALTPDMLKQLVSNYATLTAAEATYESLKDVAVAEAKIAAIPQPVTLKLATRDSIEGARAAYDALNADQKLLVSNYDVLTAAEATWAGLTNVAPAGALSGKYTINDGGDFIYFAHGNLQYTRENLDADWSTGTFRLAENQYDLIELVKSSPNSYCTDNYGDKTAVGLFGWGTWGEGKTPNLTSSDRSLYTWSTDFSGALEGTDTWRTLTKDEWVYLLAHNNQSYATVHGVNGLLVAPDGKDIEGKSMTDWVEINDETWTTMQNDGYLFLPACGQRSQLNSTANIITGGQGTEILYYSSTQYSDVYAHNIWYKPGQDPAADDYSNKRQAFGVRLVSAGVNPLDSAQHVKDLIDAIPTPVEFPTSGAAIAAALNAYDALSDAAKGALDASDMQKLTDAAAAYEAARPFAPITTAPAAVAGLKYNGAAQALITAGEVEHGTLYYSLDGENWSEELPTAIPAGAYTVYYKVTATDDYKDVAPQTIAAAIAKADIDFDMPQAVAGLVYTTKDQTLIAAGESEDGTFLYSIDNTNWADTLPKATDAGTYQVYYKIQGDANHNDYIAAEPLEVSIAKAALTITAENKEVVYGYAAPGFSVSYSGLKGSDLPADVLTGELSYACNYTAGSNAGEYDITPSGQTSANYDITYVKGKLAVYKADPAFTAPTANTLTYNGGAQTLIAAGTTGHGTFEYTFTPNDDESWNTALPQAKNAETYGVYYRVVGDANHNDYESADAVVVTIAKAALTATADDKSVIYGDDAPEYTVTYEGWQGEDNTDVLSGTIAYACEYARTSNVGEYDIIPSGISNPDYTITFVNGKVTVSKAALTITADNKEVTYGDEAPAFTVTYEGFKNEDDETVVSGLTLTSEYVLTSNVGEYDIVPADATAQNYDITFVNGTLTVNRAALMITAEDKEVTYGDEAPAFTVTYEGWKNADDESVVSGLTLTSEYVLTSNVGEYDIVPANATAQNYAISYTNGTLTVNKAALMITADDKEVIYGDEAPAFTASYEGWKNADDESVVSGLKLTSEYVLTSNVGEYDIVPANAEAQNYAISYTNGTLTVNQAPLTITAEDKTMIYGDEAPEFTVTYEGFKNEDDESVVSGLNYTCAYAPGSFIGTYVINPNSATAQNYAITFVDATLTVNRATVYVSDADIQEAKFEDGNTDAVVLNAGVLNGIKLNDPIGHETTASFSDASVGEGKTITMFYELTGDAALLANYDLTPASEIFAAEGVIIEKFIPDNNPEKEDDEAEVKEGIEVYAYGYCDGSGYSLRYHLNSGNPDQYKIDFADSRFTDVDWTNLTTPGKDGTIDIEIPVDIPTGDYTFTATFRDSRFTWLESNALNVTFHVNLPETYVMPQFNNVIALVDTCECFTDIQWYHRSDASEAWQAIPGATGHYYRPADGSKLTGEFFVKASMNGVPTYTCKQTDMETLYGADSKQPKATVKAFPNPVTTTTNVTIENSENYEHSLRVVNLTGVEMFRTTFEGNETQLNMDGFVQGSYMISVDGIVVKVMKK